MGGDDLDHLILVGEGDGQVLGRREVAGAALALVGALGNVPELLPAFGCFGVERCCVGMVAGVFGELGAGGAEGVLVERVAGFEPVDEPLGERGVAGGERRTRPSRALGKLRIDHP